MAASTSRMIYILATTVYGLIIGCSPRVMGGVGDPGRHRDLQQTGQQLVPTMNPFSTMYIAQPVSGFNANLGPNRNQVISAPSKYIELQNINNNPVPINQNPYNPPFYPPAPTVVAKATRHEASSQVTYGPYGRMETNTVRVSSAEQNIGSGLGVAASTANTITINNNYYGAMILPMPAPLYSPPMSNGLQLPLQL